MARIARVGTTGRIAALFGALALSAACGAASGPGDGAAGSASADKNASTAKEGEGGSGGAKLEGEPILLGAALAETSNLALLGQEQATGVRLAEELINARGGVNGRPIKILIQDTAGDEAGAVNAFQSLIGAGVVGIVGPGLSQQAFAADEIAEQAKVPVIGPSNTAKGIPEIGDYIARVSAPVAIVAPLAIEEALKANPDIKVAAVAYAQNDAFSTSETKTFQETLKAKSIEVATVQTFQTTDTDFTTQVNNILAKKPQLVIVSGLIADGGNLVRQLRELSYTGIVVGGNGFNSANMFPVCGEACDGTIVAQAYSPELDNEINAAFRAAHVKAEHKQPPQFTGQAFAAVQVFVEALSRLDKEKPLAGLALPELRTALNAAVLAGTYETPLGTISFDPIGEVKQERFYVSRIDIGDDGKSGQLKLIR
ncbi:MAG: ABC transporter substrate-binding protein [Acidimicrobiia bacterium]